MAERLVLSPQAKAQIDEQALAAARSAQGAKYVVYAMIDPRQADPHGEYPGRPIYVGEARDVSMRVRDHYRRARDPGLRAGTIAHAIRAMMVAGTLPAFVILERFETKFAAAEAETPWAQRLLAKGHLLKNQWLEQRRLMPDDEVQRYILLKRWGLSVQDAIEADLRISVRCRNDCRSWLLCGRSLLRHFPPQTKLGAIKNRSETCKFCGAKNACHVIDAGNMGHGSPKQ
jgi:hypothetical protein